VESEAALEHQRLGVWRGGDGETRLVDHVESLDGVLVLDDWMYQHGSAHSAFNEIPTWIINSPHEMLISLALQDGQRCPLHEPMRHVAPRGGFEMECRIPLTLGRSSQC
jgi:hypothetical protein